MTSPNHFDSTHSTHTGFNNTGIRLIEAGITLGLPTFGLREVDLHDGDERGVQVVALGVLGGGWVRVCGCVGGCARTPSMLFACAREKCE